MAQKAISHFESYDWLGYFWIPGDKPSDRFSGRVTYNPIDGVQLEVVLPAHDRSGESDVIHGVLATGKLCTIFCSFRKKHLGFVMAGAPLFTDKLWCEGIILGAHIDSGQKFTGLVVDFTNFDEFCHPVDRNDDLAYQEGAIQSSSSDGVSVVVFNKANFLLWAKHDALFHSRNRQLTEEVAKFFDGLENKYPNETLMTRKSIGWGVEIDFTEGRDFGEMYVKCCSLESFLSLLIYMPVRRNVVSLVPSGDSGDEKKVPLPVLRSLFDMDNQKVKILHTKQPHEHLPFTFKTIDFSEATVRWLSMEDHSYLLPDIVSTNFGSYSRHQIYAEIVLVLTELEGISMNIGKGGKYSLAITEYAHTPLLQKLKSLCGREDVEGIAEFLSDLRAEIAHVGKRRTILKKQGSYGLLEISRCLKLTIASKILSDLGISPSNIYKYQAVFVGVGF